MRKTKKVINNKQLEAINFRRRRFLRQSATLAIALAFGLPSRVWGAVKMITSRLGDSGGDDARFVLELDEKSEYSITYLEASGDYARRILIDIKNCDLNNDLLKNSKKLKFIDGYRLANASAGTSRVILDLNQPAVVVKDFWLAPASGMKHRLVIDMKKTSARNFSNLAGVKTASAEPAKEVAEPPKQTARIVPKIIVLDPGHGGTDPGAISRKGVYEKNIVLLASTEFKRQLEATGGYKVLLTRSSDKFLSLGQRIAYGQQINLLDKSYSKNQHADVFMSIHADSLPKNSARRDTTRGLSVYTLSEKATSAEAAKLAERENAADFIEVDGFENYTKIERMIFADLTQSWVKSESASLANHIVKEIDGTSGIDLVSKLNSHKSAAFAVLKTNVPAVLVELGYLSNLEEEKLLQQSWYRAKLASAMVKAVKKYTAA